jgi:hypothetical protein
LLVLVRLGSCCICIAWYPLFVLDCAAARSNLLGKQRAVTWSHILIPRHLHPRPPRGRCCFVTLSLSLSSSTAALANVNRRLSISPHHAQIAPDYV